MGENQTISQEKSITLSLLSTIWKEKELKRQNEKEDARNSKKQRGHKSKKTVTGNFQYIRIQ
jgi:hypothetical protein